MRDLSEIAALAQAGMPLTKDQIATVYEVAKSGEAVTITATISEISMSWRDDPSGKADVDLTFYAVRP